MKNSFIRNRRSEKSAIGWRSIRTLENDYQEIHTTICEEPLTPEMIELLQAQAKADKALRIALIYAISEVGYN